MTQPPYQHDPDRPQDVRRSFPSYTEQPRPQDTPPPFVPPYSAHQQPAQHQQPYPQQQSYQRQQPYQQPQQPAHPPYQQQFPPAYGPPPVPYGYGYGYPGVARRTNGLATAAMVTGLASVVFTIAAPVAIGLGIAALVQLKRRNEDGTAQAVIGLVAGAFVTLLAGVVIALIAIGSALPDDEYSGGTPTSTSTAGVYIDALSVGECFDDTDDEDEVVPRTCTELHDGELYAVVTLPAQAWPGEDRLGDLSEEACDKEFAPYVGIDVDDSILEPVSWYPEQAGWNGGDRKIYCTTYGPSGDQLDSTVKDSKR